MCWERERPRPEEVPVTSQVGGVDVDVDMDIDILRDGLDVVVMVWVCPRDKGLEGKCLAVENLDEQDKRLQSCT